MRGKWHSCVASRRDSQRLSGSCERSYRNCASVQKTSIKWEESHGKSRTDPPKHWPLKSLAIENSWVGYRISKKCRMLKHVETCWNLLKPVETCWNLVHLRQQKCQVLWNQSSILAVASPLEANCLLLSTWQVWVGCSRCHTCHSRVEICKELNLQWDQSKWRFPKMGVPQMDGFC